MRPEIQFTVKPDLHSDYSRVNIVATVTDQYGIDHDVVLYDQLRIVLPLTGTMSVELWAYSSLSNIASAVQAALYSLVTQGSLTLIGNADEQ